MKSSVSFFKAFFGACSGRQIFYALRLNSWGRCIFHIFLLSIITGVIIGQVQLRRAQGSIDAAEAAFTNIFGKEICIDPKRSTWNWVCPARDAAFAREMALPGGGRFYYTGVSNSVPESLKNVTGSIIVWSPEKFAMAIPAGDNTYNSIVINDDGKMKRSTGSLKPITDVFEEKGKDLPDDPQKLEKEEVSDIFLGISTLLGFSLTIGAVLRNFLLVWLYTGLFMGMYRLLNGASGRLRFLTLREMWKCGIYAAFPAMAVASLFPILDLPFVSYETVFMIGLLVYWMAVTAKLERTPVENKDCCDNE